MRLMFAIAVTASGVSLSAADSATPKTDIASLDMVETWSACTQDQAKKNPKKSETYVAKLCGCGVDYERTRRIKKLAKGTLLTEAGPTAKCHTYATANEKATVSRPTPFSRKLHRSTDQLVGAFAGCFDGATTANPPMPEDQARSSASAWSRSSAPASCRSRSWA